MGILSRLFGGGTEPPESDATTEYFVDDNGQPTEMTLLNEEDSGNFLDWLVEHREEAKAMFSEPEPEHHPWWKVW